MVFCVPETKQISLEEMDVLFGGTNHVEKGGDLLHVDNAHHASIGIDNSPDRNIAGDHLNTGKEGVELDERATHRAESPAKE